MEKEDALKKCGVFAAVEDADLQWLVDEVGYDLFEQGQVVFEEGDTSSRVYVVASGSLHVRVGAASKLVSFAEAGALFGEYAMFVKGVRTARGQADRQTLPVLCAQVKFACPTWCDWHRPPVAPMRLAESAK